MTAESQTSLWVPLPNRARLLRGFYLIKNVADDGGGHVDHWITIAEWSGRQWISIGVCAKSRSVQHFSQRHAAEQKMEHAQ